MAKTIVRNSRLPRGISNDGVYPKEFVKMFWNKVNKKGQMCKSRGRCWLWTKAKFSEGYGAQRFRGRQRKSHRISWEMANRRSVPDGMIICHHCDNPSCVRPSHLFLGTFQDNMDDKHVKGRQRYVVPYNRVKGERVHTAKLTDSKVKSIRREYRFGSSAKGTYGLARKYNVDQGVIYSIVSGKTWKHLL